MAMITAHLTIQPRMTAIRVRSWEAAKIQSSWRTVVERLSRPAIQQMTATIASTITVQRVTSCEKKTTTDSMAAIHNDTRMRFASSQRPAREDPWSTMRWESLLNTVQPYHAGGVIQVCARRRNARPADSACALWWKSPYTVGP